MTGSDRQWDSQKPTRQAVTGSGMASRPETRPQFNGKDFIVRMVRQSQGPRRAASQMVRQSQGHQNDGRMGQPRWLGRARATRMTDAWGSQADRQT
jgi:hypothetical protein